MYRLLIAEESPAMRNRVAAALDWHRYGFDMLLTAGTYNEALSHAIDCPPHIAVIGLRLGDRWGYDLCSQLRSVGLQTVCCILADSGEGRFLRRCMQAGAQDYLTKPLDSGELRSFVERTVTRELHAPLPEELGDERETDPILHRSYSQFSAVTGKILLIVQGGFQFPQSLTRIAEGMGMSPKYIGRVFRKETGMKFTDYLTACRMREARRLVENTQEKISVIASMVGYPQLNNFYTHFKDYYGISPSAMRDVRLADIRSEVGFAGEHSKGDAL